MIKLRHCQIESKVEIKARKTILKKMRKGKEFLKDQSKMTKRKGGKEELRKITEELC